MTHFLCTRVAYFRPYNQSYIYFRLLPHFFMLVIIRLLAIFFAKYPNFAVQLRHDKIDGVFVLMIHDRLKPSS